MPPQRDPARGWRGTSGGKPDLRIQRYGGCEFREMPASHTVVSEAGYPRYFADRLASRGLTVEFSDRFTETFDELPRTAAELHEHVKLTAPPDLVLLQVGTNYAYRTLLGEGGRRRRIRDWVGRSLGRRAFGGYRIVDPVVRRLGRPYLRYGGAERLDDFVALVRSEWPEAEIVAIGLFPVMSDGSFDPGLQRRVSQETLDRARRLGVETLETEGLLPPDPGLYCANGAQLSPKGSRLVADALYGWWSSRARKAR